MLLALPSAPAQASGGDTSCPSQVYLAGIEPPKDRPLDGYDITSAVTGGKSPRREMFYYRSYELMATRLGPWKAHFLTQTGYGQPRHSSPQRVARAALPLASGVEESPADGVSRLQAGISRNSTQNAEALMFHSLVAVRHASSPSPSRRRQRNEPASQRRKIRDSTNATRRPNQELPATGSALNSFTINAHVITPSA